MSTIDKLVPAMLDVVAVATLLACSTRTVYRLADGGEIPRPVKLGGMNRWPRFAFDNWLAGVNASAASKAPQRRYA